MGFSLLFILFEWLRATLLTGFPWLLLGQALIDTPLASLAPIVGEFGLGFLGFLLSALLATGCMLNKKRYFILFVLPFMLVSPLSAITWTHSYATPLKVSLVQGNVSQNQKWVSIHLDDIIDRYVMLTEENWSSDLIIWPETAIPMPSLYLNSLLSELEEKASQHHTHLLVGIPYSKEGITLTNAMMMLGDHRARYEKRHLVPFGEYVPFTFLRRLMTYFDIPLGSLKAGSIKQAPLLFNNVRLAPFICYDIVFSQLLLPYLPSSNLIVTLSDDSWYGHSFAKAQHLQIARLRSLESGRAQIFSTNNGLTALINEKGVITKQLREEKVGVLTGHIELKTGNTPWGHLGDIPFIILFLIMLLCLIFYQRIYRK
jgi:apolipoprotein N-acyltransferase